MRGTLAGRGGRTDPGRVGQLTDHVLVVRLDGMGDVLCAGPAVRAIAAGAHRLTFLAGPHGADAARLLPGVDEVLVWSSPWILNPPPPVSAASLDRIIAKIAGLAIDRAVVLTSFHQSPLPTALVLRLAGVPFIAASCEDYPGSLLDVRLPVPADNPEPLRMLETATGLGYKLPPGDTGWLAIRDIASRHAPVVGGRPGYVVVHPGTSAPARAYPPEKWAEVVQELTASGHHVMVTGSTAETTLTAAVAAGASEPESALDLGGRLNLAELATVLSGASVVVVANTGPAHLAAAVDVPVVSLFAPVVPAVRWAPHGRQVTVLGDEHAPCKDSRATTCPVAGHPCLNSVSVHDILRAVQAYLAPLPEWGIAT